jgi:hypothetical protein
VSGSDHDLLKHLGKLMNHQDGVIWQVVLFAVANVSAAERPGSRFNLRAFAEGRQTYLLQHPEIKQAGGG